MWIGRRQLSADIARWRQQGWITAEGENAIHHELLVRRRGPGLAAVLGILGVVLLGFAAMSFVAANWQEMPRLVRLGIIFSGLLGAYGAAAALFARGLDAFAHAAILLGVAVFGAGIMLIAQMYHIDGHPPDAVLVWALGALAAGVLVRSNPALAAAAVLFGLWTGMESAVFNTPHWSFLLAVGALATAFTVARWWPGAHLVGLLLAGFTIRLGYVLDRGHAHELVVLAGLVVAGLAVAMSRGYVRLPLVGRHSDELGVVLLGYGVVITFAGLLALQFFDKPDLTGLVVLAALTLALLVAVIYLGLATGNRAAVWIGYTAFSFEILALYFKTVGTLFGSSVFFLVAGLIVIALAAAAWRLHRAEELQLEEPQR